MAKAYLRPSRTSTMVLFCEISIDVCLGSKYAPAWDIPVPNQRKETRATTVVVYIRTEKEVFPHIALYVPIFFFF